MNQKIWIKSQCSSADLGRRWVNISLDFPEHHHAREYLSFYQRLLFCILWFFNASPNWLSAWLLKTRSTKYVEFTIFKFPRREKKMCRCVGCLFSDSPPWTWFTRVIMGALRHAPTSGFAHIIITYGLCRTPLAHWALGQQRSEPRQQLDASRCTPPKKEASARRVVKIWGNGARICRQGLAHLCCLSCRAYVSSFLAPYRQQLSQLQQSLCTPHSTQPGVRRLGGWHFQRC